MDDRRAPGGARRLSMLDRYYVRPETIDRIRSSWLGPPIDQYVTWMLERGYAARNLAKRVPLLLHFGTFAQQQGAASYAELPAYVDTFVDFWVHRRDRGHHVIGRARLK